MVEMAPNRAKHHTWKVLTYLVDEIFLFRETPSFFNFHDLLFFRSLKTYSLLEGNLNEFILTYLWPLKDDKILP